MGTISSRPSGTITLSDYIEEVGIDHLARVLKIHRNTVRYWKIRHCYPRVPQMRKIKRLSRGRCGYEQMIDRPLLTRGVK